MDFVVDSVGGGVMLEVGVGVSVGGAVIVDECVSDKENVLERLEE